MPAQVRRSARGSAPVNSRLVRRLANDMLDALELQDAELSILLTNDAQIQVLNREHRHKDRPTDVLSFYVSGEVVLPVAGAPRLLGDIVISIDTALRQANGRKRSLMAEIRWLLAHGILHLIGYDHQTPQQKQQMVAQTRRLVRAAPLPESDQ